MLYPLGHTAEAEAFNQGLHVLQYRLYQYTHSELWRAVLSAIPFVTLCESCV